MSRWEFMRQLEELLSDISPNEREEALQYYNDYFNDAGKENEQEVIKALGTPGQVAQIVREGLGDGGVQGEFTENGFSGKASQATENELIKREADGPNAGQSGTGVPGGADAGPERTGSRNMESAGQSGADGQSGAGAGAFGAQSRDAGGTWRESGFHESGAGSQPQAESTASSWKNKELPAWAVVLIVIGCILCSPVILGLAGSLLGILLGVFGTVLGLVFGIGLLTAILFIVAVSLLAAGFGCLLAYPFAGLGLLGAGLICGALGSIFLLCTTLLLGKGIPALCRGVSYLYHRIFDRRKGAAA